MEDVGEFKEKGGKDQTIMFIMGDLPPVSTVELPKSILHVTSLKGFLGGRNAGFELIFNSSKGNYFCLPRCFVRLRVFSLIYMWLDQGSMLCF